MAASSLREVAALAGVSIKTVSNVVHDNPHVAPRTRARVETAIKQLGYRPNLYARSLRGGRSGVIALAIPRIDSPYFAELGRCVINAAREQGWTVFIDETDGDVQREQAIISGLGPHMIDGLIFSPLALGAADLAAHGSDAPVVMLGERTISGTADHVAIDNISAAHAATAHLIAAGRRRIAAIGDQPYVATETARLRVAGYRAALAEAGIKAEASLLREPEAYTREGGARSMLELLDLDSPPDAIFCFTDLMAMGALRALHERGVRVPDDIAVMGFDDIAEGRFGVPSLSTISPDKQQIANSAVALLAERLGDGASGPTREIKVSFELVVRESTGARLQVPCSVGSGRQRKERSAP